MTVIGHSARSIDVESEGPSINPTRNDQPESDADLVRQIRDGASDPVRTLMDRYDRLVRYTVFRAARDRCQREPDWLDARASETWTGFIRSVRRPGGSVPADVGAYLVRITRNKVRDALRIAQALADRIGPAGDHDISQIVDENEDTADSAARLEELAGLRACIKRLSDEDQRLCGEIHLIADRRWKEAAERLGMAESTLRSRWERVLDRLRRAMGQKK